MLLLDSQPVWKIHKSSRTLDIQNRKTQINTSLKSMISTRNIYLNQNEKRAKCQTKKNYKHQETRRATARSESALLTDSRRLRTTERNDTDFTILYPMQCLPYTARQTIRIGTTDMGCLSHYTLYLAIQYFISQSCYLIIIDKIFLF